MKIQIQMHDPDAMLEGIDDAVKMLTVEGLDADELKAVRERRKEKAHALCARWFEYGEYLIVEVDTDAETCVVVPAK